MQAEPEHSIRQRSHSWQRRTRVEKSTPKSAAGTAWNAFTWKSVRLKKSSLTTSITRIKENGNWGVRFWRLQATHEDEIRKLSVQLRYFEQTAEGLQQRLSMLNAAFTDLNYANMTLESIQKEQDNAEMLVTIGGSSYVSVKLANQN